MCVYFFGQSQIAAGLTCEYQSASDRTHGRAWFRRGSIAQHAPRCVPDSHLVVNIRARSRLTLPVSVHGEIEPVYVLALSAGKRNSHIYGTVRYLVRSCFLLHGHVVCEAHMSVYRSTDRRSLSPVTTIYDYTPALECSRQIIQMLFYIPTLL
jgi:hypothetical protein